MPKDEKTTVGNPLPHTTGSLKRVGSTIRETWRANMAMLGWNLVFRYSNYGAKMAVEIGNPDGSGADETEADEIERLLKKVRDA